MTEISPIAEKGHRAYQIIDNIAESYGEGGEDMSVLQAVLAGIRDRAQEQIDAIEAAKDAKIALALTPPVVEPAPTEEPAEEPPAEPAEG